MDASAASEVLSWTKKIIDACGPRPAGSVVNEKAAKLIADDLRPHCDRVEIQPFECHPLAFIWHGALTTPLGILGCVLLALGYVVPAAVLLVGVALASVLEFGFYRETFDPLFPRRRCFNVMGVLEPKGLVRRQVVVSAHHDSAYEFTFLRHSRKVYITALGWYGVMLYGMPVASTALAALALLGVGYPAALAQALGVVGAIGGVIGLFVVSRRPVPGAGDNLVSTGMLVGAAKRLREKLAKDPEALAGTRVILASFDAEESGLRGSRAFVRDQRALLESAPAVDVNLESFFHLDSFSALTSDLNGWVKLSDRLVAMVEEEAKAEGLPFVRRGLYYGIGATDAASFARAGIPATCILGMSPSPLHPKPLPYHTRDDVPENLEPEVVAAGLTVALRMVERLSRDESAFQRTR